MSKNIAKILSAFKQREKRVNTCLPVSVNGKLGVTRDISATGVYFTVDDSYEKGTAIEFWIELDTPGGPLKLQCNGEVMRVDNDGARSGIAVKILDQSLQNMDKNSN